MKTKFVTLLSFVMLMLASATGYGAHGVFNGRRVPVVYIPAAITNIDDTGMKTSQGYSIYKIRYLRTCKDSFVSVVETPMEDFSIVGVVLMHVPSSECELPPPGTIAEEIKMPLRKKPSNGWASISPRH